MRPYHIIPIIECDEPLVKIPLEKFALESPHPYEKLGAPYGNHSPYFLREKVVDSLIQAQNYLQQLQPQWQIQIFDAYRPIPVQQFMVDYSFQQESKLRGFTEAKISAKQRQEIWHMVDEIWAIPSLDEKTPPPHSTGAAVDITLVNERREVVDMGSPIDELSTRSHPDYYAKSKDTQSINCHNNRQLLNSVMVHAGFQRNPREWWHFSLGDQMWAWLNNQSHTSHKFTACYGRV